MLAQGRGRWVVSQKRIMFELAICNSGFQALDSGFFVSGTWNIPIIVWVFNNVKLYLFYLLQIILVECHILTKEAQSTSTIINLFHFTETT